MATKAPARRTRAKAPAVTQDDFRRIKSWLSTRVLLERDRELETLILVALAGVNLHQIAKGGVAKSLMCREFCSCIAGAEFYEIVLHPMTRDSELIGTVDPRLLMKGEWGRASKGTLPTAQVVFLDELLRSSAPARDVTMPMLNAEERRYRENGHMKKCEARFMTSASNTYFDPEDAYSQAVESRITVVQQIEDLKADDSFKELFRRHHTRRQGERDGSLEKSRETITLAQFDQAQAEVAAIEPTDDFLEAFVQVRRQVRDEGLDEDSRHWMELGRIARANAWMAGRTTLQREDVVPLAQGIGKNAETLIVAKQILHAFRSKFEQAAEDRAAEAEELFGKVAAVQPRYDGIPSDQRVPHDLQIEAIDVLQELAEFKLELDKTLAEAAKAKASASELHGLADQIQGVLQWADSNGLPTYGGLTR